MNYVKLIDPGFLEGREQDLRYAGSAFSEVHQMQASAKGARFAAITQSCLEKLGTDVEPRDSSEHDLIIGGVRIELKGSTLVRDKDHFSFLQIRPEQDYDMLMLSLFYPDHLTVVALSKQTLIDSGALKAQHCGEKGHSGTFLFYATEQQLLEIGGTVLFRCA